MGQVSTIGLDLAKSIFQVHGADALGAVVVRKRLRRSQVRPFLAAQPPCTVAMEACGSAPYWVCSLLGATKRMVGRCAASQIASASVALFFCRLTKGFT